MRRRVVAAVVVVALVAAVAGIVALRPREGGGDHAEGEPTKIEGVSGANAPASAGLAIATEPAHAGGMVSETTVAAGSPVACEILGKAVDDRRRPIAGAVATLRAESVTGTSTPTGTDGRFRIGVVLAPGSRWLWGAVVVVDGAHRAAVETFSGRPGTIDVGRVELGTAPPLTIEVTDGGRPAGKAAVTVWAVADGDEVVVGEGTTGEEGRVTVSDLPEGMLHVLAVGPTGRRARARVPERERGTRPVEIALAPAGVLRVRVVEAEDGRTPIEGATVFVDAVREDGYSRCVMAYRPTLVVAPTDASGRTTIAGLCLGEELDVEATAPGHARGRAFGDEKPSDPASPEEETRIDLERLRSVAWPLVAGERPVPASGTAVRLRRCPPTAFAAGIPSTARVDGDRLILDGVERGDVHALATAPDGSVAELHATRDAAEGPPTSFRAPRRIEVTVTDEAGAALSGIRAVAWNNGGEAWSPIVETDEKGIAVLAGLPARELRAAVGVTRRGYGPCVTRDVDLREQDARVSITLGAPREVVVHLRTEGEPGLPSHVRAEVGEARELDYDENPDTATLHLTVRPLDPRGEGSLSVSAGGWDTFWWHGAWPALGTPLVLDADLRREARLEIDVKAPPGLPLDLRLERPNEEGKGWPLSASLEDGDRPGPHVVAGILPGRCRVRDATTGACSEVVEIPDPPQSRRVVLDLSGAYSVSGRVSLPDGYQPWEARVVPEGPGIDAGQEERYPGGKVDNESLSFRVWVPWPGPVSLRVQHPQLLPAREGGRVAVSGPRDDVVLRLVEGPRLRFTVKGPAASRIPRVDRPLFGEEIDATQLRLFSGDVTGPPRHSLDIEVLEEGGCRATGFEPGTYTLFFDIEPFAPRVLRGIALGQEVTDLGELTFEAGSCVNVTVKAAATAGISSVGARTEAIDGPRYGRSSVTMEGVERIRGVGAGRHRLHVHWNRADGGGGGREQEVEVDGVHDVAVEIDVEAK